MSAAERSGPRAAEPETARAAAATHPCVRCASAQRTCCQRAEVLVTLGDLGRIAAAAGRRDFVELRAAADPTYTEPDPADPMWVRYTVRPDGTRRVLRREATGDCTFLGAGGCVLPAEARPLVCRLYPYDYTESRLTAVGGEFCPTSLFAGEGGDMAEVLGMEAAGARRWHAMLYEELRAEVRDEER